jgi:hypothetical protein
METQYIHHLIAFSEGYMEAQKTMGDINVKKDKKAWAKFKKSSEYFENLLGGKYRGSYLDKQELIDRIKKSTDVYDLCEGYYMYLLIETHQLNAIDACNFDPPTFIDTEMWFQFIKLGEDNYEYQQIPRPECLAGVCNFL